jgi:DNA-binding beta-propeller fold protein YncE
VTDRLQETEAAPAESVPGEADLPTEDEVDRIRCAVCLEWVPESSEPCPECGEPPGVPPSSRSSRLVGALDAPPPSLPPSQQEREASWLGMHWRPVVMIGVIGSVMATGVALRYLAPGRYRPPNRLGAPAAAVAPCEGACWHGEACQVGRCVWAPKNDVGHLEAQPTIGGPFTLPEDVVDALPLDGGRWAASYLSGVQIRDARTGRVLSLLSDAPQAQALARVGESLYATSPRRIFVIDVATTRVLKVIEMGSPVSQLVVGAAGRRVLAAMPGARAVAVIAADYHAEINRFFFGDDPVGLVAVDDEGSRALASNGVVPLPGLAPPQSATMYGATFAFDPSRLPSAQDRVRTAMMGNPASMVVVPDSKTSWVVVREKDELVPVEHLASGAVRLGEPLRTCREPEEALFVPRGRRILVRCNAGKAVEIFDLVRRELLRHVPLNARVADAVVSPDARAALLALPGDGSGALGVLDLDGYELVVHPLGGEPHRVRIAPDGRTALVLSDRTKVAWVLR